VVKVNKTGYINASNDNLKTLMEHWLFVYKKSEVSSRTFERILGNVRKHIFPEIGSLTLEEITTDTIQTIFGKLINNKKLAVESVKKVKFPLSQFFEYAIENNYIEKNPVAKTVLKARDKDKSKEKIYKAVRKEDRTAFMEAINKHNLFKPLCYTAMFAGLRIGEVLALKWRDLDLKKGNISIENSITQVVEFDEEGNVMSRKTIISDTKTAASERENPMPEILVKALKEYKKRREAEEMLSDGKISFTKHEDIVFSTNTGKLRTYWGTNTLFTRFLKKHNLEKKGIHFHTLRHTFSNMLFEAGENPKVIQSLMGHRDVKTTMIYNSVDKRQIAGARNVLNQISKTLVK